MSEIDTDVLVIGSGFGGAVAALRFAELGERVTVLERGDWISRDKFRADLDFFWIPERDCFGMNDIKKRGPTIMPWIGAAVGGGSHVFAGTLKRADTFRGYPAAIASTDMSVWYDKAEELMLPVTYPTYAPYGDNGALLALRMATRQIAIREPKLIADRGLVKLAISFAPEGSDVDAEFTNPHGATQCYHHPHEQSILGGDIGAKNSLDKNYLHVASERGAQIQALTEVERIEPIAGGAWRVHYKKLEREPTAWRRLVRRWWPWRTPRTYATGAITARRLVVSAGSIGSTKLLLRARDVDRTLPKLSSVLGSRYTTNGDYLSLLVPLSGVWAGWLGFATLVAGLVAGVWALAAIGAAFYYGQVAWTRSIDADLGTTNSDYVRFCDAPGISDCIYVESGRYPTPGRLVLALLLGTLGNYRPHHYRRIVKITRWIRILVPPLALLSRMWPIPLLKMGRDHAVGEIKLDAKHDATIEFDPTPNRAYYRHLEELGKKIARAAKALWVPNLMYRVTKTLEVPHNQGGVPMGESPADGVVDHAGRVFGYDNLMVLDGSIIPVSPGPNPAHTILALSERAMSVIAAQLQAGDGTVRAEPATATSPGTEAPAKAAG